MPKPKIAQDYFVDGSDYLLSLSKLTGRKIKDVSGYITREFGDPTFKVNKIIFDDGYEQYVEGEHDLPYLVDFDEKSQELIEKIDKEEREESDA